VRRPLIHRRGALGALLLLALVLIGTGMQIAFGSSSGPSGSAAARATVTPTPATGRAVAVVRALATVEQAFNAGDVALLCRRGGPVDPAVIRRQNAAAPGCEAELEALMADTPPLRLSVSRIGLRRDLATVTFTNARGRDAVVDVVRRSGRWLLSFSQGNDPMPVLAGTQ
jgi:hypothetical protein